MKKMTTSSIFRIVLTTFAWLQLASIRAEIKNFTFHGIISEVSDRNFVLDGSVVSGTAFDGFYVFDSSATDSNPNPTAGDYQFTNSAFGAVVKVGNYVFRTNPKHVDFLIGIENGTDEDSYLFRSYHNVCSHPLVAVEISWQLDDFSRAALSNTLLPTNPPTLSAWQSIFGLTIADMWWDELFLRGTITSISNAPPIIPERPVVTLHDAVELRWPSSLGYFYQIQSSADAQTWTNVGEPVLGDGAELSRFFARQPGRNFYRAEIANFQK